MVNKLFKHLMENGELSQKRNVLTFFSGKNDNVLTKKITLPKDKKLTISGCAVKSISLTSNNGKFDDVNPHDMRVNFTNKFDKWLNLHAHLLSGATLNKIADALNIK